MKKIFLLIATFTSIAGTVFAQKENNVWAFGDHMGLDFNSGSPAIISTGIQTLGGSASVCDANGRLLFYTQGDTIWNRNHQVMPNSAGLIAPYTSNAGSQSSQGQLIVPVINNPSQYYVFSMESSMDNLFGGDPYAGRLYYSIVDMTLNSGLGGIVPTARKIKLDSVLTSEKMIAIPGNNCSVWLLVHGVGDNTFKAYRINNNGIVATPVTSVSGTMTGPASYALGKMKVSPDGHKLAVSSWMFGTYGLELFNFNQATGVVSNPVVIDSIPQSISACFSPDNSKLYEFSFAGGNGALYQYNLSLSGTAAIIGSRTLIDTLYGAGTSVYDAKIGPDGKIYLKMPYSPSGPVPHDTIGRINLPNNAGTACGYTRAALVSAQTILLGNGDLPNDFVKPLQDTTSSSSTTNLALNGTIALTAPAGYTTYRWSTGDTTGTITVNTTGTFWVRSSSYCSFRTDTFVVLPRVGIAETTPLSGLLRLYPNPAAGELKITLRSATVQQGNIRITDLSGRTVMAFPMQKNELSINTAGMANGVYIVTYTNDKEPDMRTQMRIVICK